MASEPVTREASRRRAALAIGRRRLLAGVAAAGVAFIGCRSAAAQPVPLQPQAGLRPEPTFPLPSTGLQPPRSLRDQLRRADRRARVLVMHNPQTGETIDAPFFAVGRYQAGPLQALNAFCRDWRANAIIQMDSALFDILAAVQRRADFTVIQMLSGYRTPATNAWLASRHVDVARNSLHMRGQAIDFSIPGVPVATLRMWALEAGAGGIGSYHRNGFVHVDTGPRRQWEG